MLKPLKQFGYPYAAFFLVIALLLGVKELMLDTSIEENGTVLSATVSAYDEEVVLPEKLTNQYQEDISTIVSELELFVRQGNISLSDSKYESALSDFSQKLLGQKVPEIYRELHLDLFGVVSSLKSSINTETTATELADAGVKIDSIKSQYAWF